MQVTYELVGLMAANAVAAVACALGYYREHARRTALFEQNQLLRREHTAAATELIALRKTLHSANQHLATLGDRNRKLAVELRGSDGTAPTCVWPHRKHEVYQP